MRSGSRWNTATNRRVEFFWRWRFFSRTCERPSGSEYGVVPAAGRPQTDELEGSWKAEDCSPRFLEGAAE
jgi:hypothetical protein